MENPLQDLGMVDKTPNMNILEYKKYHESFMENNHGSTALHTFMCIFFTVQCSLYCAISTRFSERYQLIYEYIVIVLPLILAHTLLADYIYLLNGVVFILIVNKFIYTYPTLQIVLKLKQKNIFRDNRIHSISCLRSLTYLITVYAILAVDFTNFPRNLAKTEKYGYSLMDTGVGLFVLMSGLVHRDTQSCSFISIIKSNVKFVSILFLLGIARFLSIKKLEYQEHVTEYGVHWNFFFTLAVCKLLSSIILSYTKHILFTSVTLLTLHELILYIGLENWVFNDNPRTNIVNANREGIASSLGYVTMYLFAAYLKQIISDKTSLRYKIQIKLLVLSILMWIATFAVDYYRPTSRTLANAGYCIYLEAVLLIVITIMYFIENQFQDKCLQFTNPLILSAINDNGLVYFLSANLLTGAINLSIKTLFVEPFETFLILNLYMIFNIVIVLYLQRERIRF